MEAIFMALIMGLLGGPVIAMAATNRKNREAYAKRKAAFEAGEGPDPDKAPFGPHKSFAYNALCFGLIFGAIGFIAGSTV